VFWRTLNRTFFERFGIGPKAYLQRLRLAGVRDDLMMSSAKTVIADVANDCGFWHMGQFARDYRILFGERPSESLSRSEWVLNCHGYFEVSGASQTKSDAPVRGLTHFRPEIAKSMNGKAGHLFEVAWPRGPLS
jgi:AraC-like DNA-binding protein